MIDWLTETVKQQRRKVGRGLANKNAKNTCREDLEKSFQSFLKKGLGQESSINAKSGEKGCWRAGHVHALSVYLSNFLLATGGKTVTAQWRKQTTFWPGGKNSHQRRANEYLAPLSVSLRITQLHACSNLAGILAWKKYLTNPRWRTFYKITSL